MLPAGFNPAIWGTGVGLYPYLKAFFPNGVQAVSGFVYAGTTPLTSGDNGAIVVKAISNGAVVSSASTGFNGYYYIFMAADTMTSGNGVVVFTTADGATNAAALRTGTPAAVTTGLDIESDERRDDTALTTLSQLDNAYNSTVAGTSAAGLAFDSRSIVASGGAFTIDGALHATDAVTVVDSGPLTIAAAGGVSADQVTLVTIGSFVNQSGADAITAGTRWLVYSANPTDDTFGGLNSGNTAIWDTAPGFGVTATGNRYVFAYQPTLTVTTTNTAKTYGDDNSTIVAGAYTITGLEAAVANAYLSDTASTAFSGNATVTSAGSVATANVAAGGYRYSLALGTLSSTSGYAFDLANTGVLTVNRRALTVAADAQSRTYGDANPALTYTVVGAGLVNSDSLSGGLATTAGLTSNVGTYAITQGSLANSNYAITYTGADLTIGARAITVAANAETRAYGDANPSLTYTVGGAGLANGDTLTGTLASTADSISNAGTYAITQGSVAASSNYALTYDGSSLTVAPRAITVAADAQTRAYGDTNPAFTYVIGGGGLVNGDTLTGVLATSADTTSNVGTYGISQNTLAASSNYALTYTGSSLTVAPRAITVAADAQTRAYGDTNPAFTYVIGGGGLVNGDTLTGVLATSADTTSNVGTYGISQNTLAASSNYALTYTGSSLTVAPRAITVAADAQTRAYGDTNPAFTYVIGGGGLVNGDTLTGVLATSADTTSNVGTYGISQNTLAASSNYALTYTGSSLTVAPRAITVAADAQTRAYGDADPAFTYVIGGGGLVNGDTLTGVLATSADTTSNVGTYGISQNTLAASSNYALTYTGSSLTVAPRAITVAADAQTRAYGDTNPAFTYVIGGGGLVNGDTLSGGLTSMAIQKSRAGRYAIMKGTLGDANYAIAYSGADLTITGGIQSDAGASTVANGLGGEPPVQFVALRTPGAGEKGADGNSGDGSSDNGTPGPKGFTGFDGYSDPRFGGTVVCLGVGVGGCVAVPSPTSP